MKKRIDFLVERGFYIWLVFYFSFLLSLVIYLPSLIWDEAVYLANSKSFFIISNYTESFRSPLLPLIVALAWLFTGEQIIVAKIITILFTTGCIYLTYKIAKTHFGKKSIYLTILFSLAPLMVYWGNKLYTDIASLFFILLSFYLMKNQKTFFSGLSLGLGFLVRYSASLFGLCILFFLVLKKKYKELIVFGLGVLILLTPWMVYNQIEYKNPIYGAWVYVKKVSKWTEPYKEPAFLHIINLIYVLGPFLIFLPFGINSFLEKDDGILIFLYMIIFFVCFTFFFNLKLARYYIMILPFLYFLIYEGFLTLKKKIEYNLPLVFFVIVSSIALVILVFTQYQTDNLRWQTIEKSVMYVKENTNPNDLIMSNFWPYFGYFTDAESLCIVDDVDYSVKSYYPSYVVYHDNFGLEVKVNESWVPKRIFSNRLGTISIYETS